MERLKHTLSLLVILAASLLACSCGRDANLFALDDNASLALQAQVDGRNKQAFVERYKDPQYSIRCASEALSLINDSLPLYYNGRLRAWNNLAYAYFMLARYDTAMYYADKVMQAPNRGYNYQIEQMIAQLLQATVLQRQCRTADSYELLRKIDKVRNRKVRKHGDKFLCDYAQMQYSITSITLDYFYRKGEVQNVELLLDNIVKQRELENWRCDYASDMALNYAMAYGNMVRCDSARRQEKALANSLYCIADNLHMLSDSAVYTVHFMANTLQLLANLYSRTTIRNSTWQQPEIQEASAHIRELLCEVFDFCPDSSENYAEALYQESTALFWKTSDPYQRLGSVVAAAGYLQTIGDTAAARDYYAWVLADTALLDGVSPRFNAKFYRGLIATHSSQNPRILSDWFQRELTAVEYISNNERADFELRNQLSRIASQNRWMWLTVLVGLAVITVLAWLMIKLKQRTNALRRETQELQEAKQKDKERIANVETCLSVLRHDVTPFISYLSNPNIPAAMRQDVTEQLIRTFDNIKSWTNLSIPDGLQYNGGVVSLQELFHAVAGGTGRFRQSQVTLSFLPTTLQVDGDRQLLEILLRNLVNNALQHTEEGSVTVSADLWQDDSRFVQVTVQDSGCGMTDDEVTDLFRADKKPHVSAAAEQGYGTGFGLILCRYIIKKHDDHTVRGCRIWAESVPGNGTKMMFLVAAATR